MNRVLLALALFATPSAGFVLRSTNARHAGSTARRVLGEDPRKSPPSAGVGDAAPATARPLRPTQALRTLEDFEIHDLLLQRSVQMLWAGLGEGGEDGGRAGRAWLLGPHPHLAPHWHSILGLALGFDDYLVHLFESSSTGVPSIPVNGRPNNDDDDDDGLNTDDGRSSQGSVSSAGDRSKVEGGSAPGKAYSTHTLARTLAMLLNRCSAQWVAELHRMAVADAPPARAAQENERRRLQALLRQGHKKRAHSARLSAAAALSEPQPSQPPPLLRRPPSRLADALADLDTDPLDLLWPQGGAAKGRSAAGDLASRLRYENAELLTRVTTLMAVDALGNELLAKALASRQPQDHVEAAWFYARVFEPWKAALCEVTASKDAPPPAGLEAQLAVAAGLLQPPPPPKPPPKPPSVAHHLLASLRLMPPQELTGVLVEPARFVPLLLDRRARAAAALAVSLSHTDARVLGVKRTLLERAHLARALVERAAEEGYYPPQPAPGPDGASESWLWVVNMAIERGNRRIESVGGGSDEPTYPVW